MLFYLQTDKSDISFGGTHRKLLTHITKKKKKLRQWRVKSINNKNIQLQTKL